MFIVLYLFKFIIPIYSSKRVLNLFIIIVYSLIGVVVYYLYSHFSGLIKNVFGSNFIKYIRNLFFKKKSNVK